MSRLSAPLDTARDRQTRRNRVTAGKKAAAAVKARRGWRERSLDAVVAGMAAAAPPAEPYVPTPIPELIERIRNHQGEGSSSGSGQGG